MFPPYLVWPGLLSGCPHAKRRECALLPRASGAFWEGTGRNLARFVGHSRVIFPCAGDLFGKEPEKQSRAVPPGAGIGTERVTERKQGRTRRIGTRRNKQRGSPFRMRTKQLSRKLLVVASPSLTTNQRADGKWGLCVRWHRCFGMFGFRSAARKLKATEKGECSFREKALRDDERDE